MSSSGRVKGFTALVILVAIISGAVLALATNFRSEHSGDTAATFPTITLGLTAEAREALQQSGVARPITLDSLLITECQMGPGDSH